MFHHLTFDAWSQAVLIRELASAYEAFSAGAVPESRKADVQYADFAAWDRSAQRIGGLAEGRSYWRRELAGASALELPTDHPRPTRPSDKVGHVDFELPPPLAGGIRALALREGTTLFTIVLAAYQTLLYRYSGERDLVVGCPVAARNRVELEELVGVFINTLPLRVQLGEEETFRQLLQRVGQTVLSALAHQEVPLQFMVQDVLTGRDTTGSPLFQAMFIHERFPVQLRRAGGVTFEPEDQPAAATMVDLALELTETSSGDLARLSYRLELWDRATIERLVGHFLTLLEGVVADADQRIGDLPLLTDAERQQVLVEWNKTDAAPLRDVCLHELIEAQVDRTPDAIALEFECGRLTYQELEERANQLAHWLRKAGVQNDEVVGLCLERSPEMVVGLLGILKAGGAYLPLDPKHPLDRITYQIEDAQMRLLLTQHRFRDRLPADGVTALCLDADSSVLASQPKTRPAGGASAGHLAYVLYTSGSTGRPKGVMVEHRAVANHLLWVQQTFPLGPNDQVIMKYALGFDPSVVEVFGTLLAGATLILARPGAHFDPAYLAGLMAARGVTHLDVVPGFLDLLLEQPALRECASLRRILCGGDTLSAALVKRVHAELPQVELANFYGPTEATISTTWWTCRRDDPQPVVPIGRPVGNVRVYVLDGRMNPVPIGVAGELFIGGAGLARGYRNQPARTAEAFVSDPFGPAGERLYRTGDRVRWRADGNLEFLGRADGQVKLRGQRIELGEIESVLNQHPSVAQSAVTLREDFPGDRQLVAFIVPAGSAPIDFNDLTRHLRARLPGYMVPTAVLPLEAFPVTPSGKVDRQRLQALPLRWAPPAPGLQLPRNALESVLYAVWQELLNGRPFGVRDDFFALGGHSLLAVTMVARLEQLCGRKLPLGEVFAGPTIEHLAEVLLREPEVPPEESLLVRVQAGGGRRPLFFLHADFLGGGFYCLKLARQLGADQPFYALGPHGLSGPRLPTSVEAMARDHLERVRSVQPEGPYLLGGYCHGGLVAFEMAQQLRAQGHEVGLLVLLVPMPVDRGSETRPLPDRLEERLDWDNRALADRRQIAMDVCLHVCRRYVPRPYPGRLTILQPRHSLPSRDDPSRGWKNFARTVEVHWIAGGHTTCLTVHAKAVGDQLRDCLHRAADAMDSHDASGGEPVGSLP
jgi:amino acid adenylation domain-containing protein